MTARAPHAPGQVRDARREDHDALQSIYHRCRHQADWLPLEARTAGDLIHDAYGESIMLATDAHDRVVGFVAGDVPDRFVHHLYVDPQHRRQGVARRLLAAFTSRATGPWRLRCLCTNAQALRCYDRLGWRPAGSGLDSDGRYLVLQWLPDTPTA